MPAPTRIVLLALLAAPSLFAQCAGTEPVAVSIPVVQGVGAQSLCASRVVTVTGVVTLASRGLSGFFLQDPTGDGDPATSDGLFVFQGAGVDPPARGTMVRATGRVVEFVRTGNLGSVTELDVRSSATALARIEVLGAAIPPPPVDLDPPLEGSAYLEAREGMLVRYPESAVVMPSNRFGEFFVLRYDRAPAWVRPSPDDPGTGTPLLVDTNGGAFRKEPKTFDLIPRLDGALHFDFGLFRLEPLDDYVVGDAGFAPLALQPRTAEAIRIASINAQQLLRSLAAAALERKLDKLALAIRDQLRSPDLLALQEVEDQELLDRLASRAGNYQGLLLRGCDFGNISVGLLYNPARVRRLAERQLQGEAPEFNNGRCTLPDGRAFTQFLFDRPPLAVDLEVDGVPLTVVVNHWRSQIGGNERERLASAEFLAAELRRMPRDNVIVLGDFNDAEFSLPLRVLTEQAGLLNLSLTVPAFTRYSLLFEGRSQAFDHVLVSPALFRRVIITGYAHYNADFPILPNDVNGTAVRAADHDNPWVDLRLR